MLIIYFLDLIGTLVFAISGSLSAKEKGMDVFGALVIASVTAIGGGTLRDMLIGSTPVGWLGDLNYLYCIFGGLFLSLLFKSVLSRVRRALFLFDTIGIAVFTILGLEKSLDVGVHPIIAIMMGTVSAVFGGLIRDILTNDVPLILRKEVYATACVSGGVLYMGLKYFGVHEIITYSATISLIMIIRLVSIRYNLSLPKA